MEEVHACVEDANLQVGRLQSIMNSQGIHIVPPLATAISLGYDCPEPEEEGAAPNFNSAFWCRPLHLQPYQLAPDATQVSTTQLLQ